MIAFLFAGSLLLTNISAHASGVVLGSYLDSGNAERAAVAARSVLQALGKTNEVRVIDGKTSAFQQLSRVVILSADEKDARGFVSARSEARAARARARARAAPAPRRGIRRSAARRAIRSRRRARR